MKVDFKTSRGQFAVVKIPNNNHNNDYTWSTEEDIAFVLDEGLEENPIEDIHVGKCSIIGFLKDLTEEQWTEVVDTYADCSLPNFMNYITNEGCSAKESGKSLVDSLGIEGDNWVLIKYK